jgi:hypothetical protein
VVVQAARHQLLAGAGLAEMSTSAEVSASVFTVWRTCCICAERPMSTDWMPCQFSSASRSARTCSVSARRSMAWRTMATSRSEPKGFSMKS